MKKISRTIQRRLAVLLSVVVAICSTPTVAYAQLIEGQSVTIAFNTGEGGYSPNAIPDGYSETGPNTGVYKANDPITETEAGTSVTLLGEPDEVPNSKVFVGWESEEGSNNIYEAGNPVALSELTSATDGGTYTFSAVYADIYSIGYELNGGNNPATANPNSWNVTDGEIPLNDPSYTDDVYTFNGWYLADDTEFVDGQEITSSVTTLSSNLFDAISGTSISLSANWIPTTRTITLYGLSGISANSISALTDLGFSFDDEDAPTTATIALTVEDSIIIPALEKEGYRFTAWDDNNTLTTDGTIVELSAGDIRSDLDFTATFEQEHTLTLVGVANITSGSVKALSNLGFTINGNTATLPFTASDASFYLPTIEKTNCEFYGWYVTGGSPDTSEDFVLFSPSTGEDASYTANFISSYTVTFKDGETTFPTLGFSYLANQTTIILPEVPNKAGYTGTGWVLDGGSDVFSSGSTSLASIGIGTTIQEGNLVFDASYTAIPRTITLTGLNGISETSVSALETAGFTFNNGSATISKTIEDSLTIPAISKAGARFIKWDDNNSETQDGKTVVLGAGDITSNLTYEAIFANEYTLTLSGLTGITADSVAAIEDAGFTINGNKATLKFVNSDEGFTIPNVAKEGYVFFGYYTGSDPEAATKNVAFTPSTAGNTTYTAYFQKIYTITFKDGGTTLPTLSDNYLSDAASISLPTLPDKTGYTKNGWILEGDESGTVHEAGALSLADIGIGTTIEKGNLIFNASYTAIERTITLVGLSNVSQNSITTLENLGFTVAGDNATITKTIEDSLTIPAVSWLHHDFGGWQKGTDEPTQTVVLAVGDITTNLSYTAVFTVSKTITVNFNLEDGAFRTADIEDWSTFGYTAGTNESLLAYSDDNLAAISNIPIPVKENSVFAGWIVNAGTDRPMSYTLPVPNNQTLNLVATWVQGVEGETIIEAEGNAAASVSAGSINTIKEILDDNVGTGATSVTKLLVVSSTAEAYAGTDIEDELNAAFDGATANITKTYVDIDITQYITSPGNSVINEIHDLGRVVDITYQPAGGVTNLKAIVREHGVAPNVTYTRFKELTATPTTLEDGTYFIDGEVVHIYTRYFSAYAFGYANGVYKVTFNTNGGNETYEPIYTDKLGTLPTPTRSGYWNFQKWTYPNGDTAAANDLVSAETVLTAVWKDTTPPPGPGPGPGPGPDPGPTTSYTITFDSNGGEPVNPITVTDDKLPTLPTTTKEGNTFDGWLYENGSKATAGDTITSDITLTASWTPVATNYTITFNANGGSAVSPVTVSDCKIPTLPSSTRENYTLDGWFYTDGTKAVAGDVIESDITLTAKWTKSEEPVPTEIIPTKNGLVVAKNDDGKNTVTLLDGTNYGKKATINTVKGTDKKTYKITRIFSKAFKDNTTITNVSIGSNVTSIGEAAFESCSALTTVKTGNTVKTIDAKAFNNCIKLKTVNIGSKVETIETDAFKGCNNLATLTIGMPNIPGELFSGYANLKKVTIGKTVKSIGEFAFASTGITKISLSGKVETIGDYAFYNCQSLTSSSMSKYVKSVGACAFQNCSSMKTASLGSNVESIGDYAYAGCASLKSFKVGKTVKTIGIDVFDGCTSLATLTIDMANIPDNLLKGSTSLKKVSIGSNARTVGDSAFDGCTSLKTLTLGGKLVSIGDYAFTGTAITKATTSKTVATIGDFAFANCASLKSATVGAGVTYIGAGAFSGDANLATLTVNSSNLTTTETVGNDFISGIKANATVKIPKKVFDQTKSIFETKGGAGSQIKYKKK